MFDLDDPLLALILRFVVGTNQQGDANEAFLQRQIQTLKKYLARFPDEEQGARAMEWIEQHAKGYREDWQRRRVSHRTLCLRCTDCPLADRGVEEHCEIHEQWLYLLRRYTSGSGVAAEFVEGALRLLQANKEQLKVRTTSALHPGAVARAAPIAAPEARADQRGGAKKPKRGKKTQKVAKAQAHARQPDLAEQPGIPDSGQAPAKGRGKPHGKKHPIPS